jgi:YgiT-type zinc finger domain-containing protein
MERKVMNETVSFQAHSLSYEQPGWHCAACGEGVLDGPDNAFQDAALHEVMARASPALRCGRRNCLGDGGEWTG